MANLPIFQTKDQTILMLQTKWKQEIEPVIQNELNQGQLLTGKKLIAGSNTINHLLGRQMVGWMVVDIDANSAIYRSEALNAATLTLTASAPCTIALWVF